mgnify:CR=1 FL=1
MATIDLLEETANYLLNHCFVLGCVEEQRAKYLYIQDHLNEVRAVFKPLGYAVLLYPAPMQAAALVNEHEGSQARLLKYESILLLVLRLLYLQKRESLAASADEVLVTVEEVQAELQKRSRQVPVGISVRHIHLTRDDVDKLFGYGYQLTPKKALSQPGQFACEECLDIIGPKGELKHVRILGPERSATQIELAQTDCRNIGIKAPVRSSGDTKGTPGVTLRGPNGTLTVPEGVMIADRHIHMTPAQAAAFGLADGDRVKVKIDGPKPGVMGGVLIRANDKCALDFHIDTDDGNAFLLKQGQLVTVLGKEE